MELQISLDYRTVWGEELVLNLGGKRIKMNCLPPDRWEAMVPGVKAEGGRLEYSFEVHRAGAVIRKEWRAHALEVPQDNSNAKLVVYEKWTDCPENSPFYSSAFTKVIFRRPEQKRKPVPSGANLVLTFNSPEIRPGQTIAVVGSGKSFASWQRPVLMDDSRFPQWTLALKVTEPMEYKYVVVDSRTLRPLMWENGSNRILENVPAEGEVRVIADAAPVFPSTPWRGAGTAVPVFSLRSEDGFGVGEFHDIKKLVDWAVKTGQSVIQLLPVNDTTMSGTWMDSYPYNANSTFALHPMFIHLPQAGVRTDKEYSELQAELNAPLQLDYERVNAEKTRLLRKAFSLNWSRIEASPEYRHFFSENREWLLPYAAFCALRDEYGTADFSSWGSMSKYSQARADSYIAGHREAADFYCYEQYVLDYQLKDAVRYAHENGVVLKGDLPIGISRTSVDAWRHPSLFHMDSQAGAPPDAFSADGQNWGFPTYNWEEMAKDGYAWWKARMRKMSEYFDAFRIDHILGFFRIWEIPLEFKSGLMGHFNPALPYSGEELRAKGLAPEDESLFLEDPQKKGFFHPRIDGKDGEVYNALHDEFFYRRHNEFWKASALKKLPELLGSTSMLACGEDLGMIPACVPSVMRDLRILSLEIQRMPKAENKEFDDPRSYPYLSVCASGTHDTETLRAWWETDPQASARFYKDILGAEGDAPADAAPELCRMIVRQHAEAPSMLCILPLQDWLSADGSLRWQGRPEDERINNPANPRHYWRWRMHLTLEQLLANTEFNRTLKSMLEEAGRTSGR